MMMLNVLFLDNFLKMRKLVHGALVGTKTLLKERAGCSPLFKFNKIHRTAFVWGPACKLVNDFANKLRALATWSLLCVLGNSLLCSRHDRRNDQTVAIVENKRFQTAN